MTTEALVGARLFPEPWFEIERKLYSAEGVQPLGSTMSLEDALKGLLDGQLNHYARKLCDSEMLRTEPPGMAINDQTFARYQERLYERRVREPFDLSKPFDPGQKVAPGEAGMRLEGIGAPLYDEVFVLAATRQFRLGVP